MSYAQYLEKEINTMALGQPIYTKFLAKKISKIFNLEQQAAVAATAVALKRIKDRNTILNLRCYQKGIYYLTKETPFGESGINKEQLLADKYILQDNGYDTGLTALHHMGLTTQMPRERVIATNNVKSYMREDKKMGVILKPARTKITATNKLYLQTLDVLELMDRAPIDAKEPYHILANYIKKHGLKYDILLATADKYYNKNTVLQLAHTARLGGAI